MNKIPPVVPIYPVIKPAKVKTDEDRSDQKKQRQNEREKNSEPDRQEDTIGPAQHIDEVV